MNLAMKNSLVIYDQKFGFFNFAENFVSFQTPKVIFLFKFKKFIKLPYGFKNQFYLLRHEKFLCNLRPKI